jgi:hypothetical protein
MKNTFKLGFVALALSLSFAACSGNKPKDGADTTVVGNTTTVVDTTKNDTTVKTAEPVKKDTVVTTETKKTVTKKM